MASGSPQGHIAFWDLERRQLVVQQRHAHSTAIAAATFLHGEPLLVTNGGDNAIKVNKQINKQTNINKHKQTNKDWVKVTQSRQFNLPVFPGLDI